MNTDRKNAIWAGVFYIIATAAPISTIFFVGFLGGEIAGGEPDPDYLVNVSANEYTGNVNFFLGQKSLDSNDWEPLDEQGEFGVLVDWKQVSWPVSIAIDILVSADEATILGTPVDAITSEINGGVRKIWEVTGSSVRPYIGGGLALISADIEVRDFITVSDEPSMTSRFKFPSPIFRAVSTASVILLFSSSLIFTLSIITSIVWIL